MKITKLVILFNKEKIIVGLVVAAISMLLTLVASAWISKFLILLSCLILLNIGMAILAAYLLYDKSNLYKPKELFKSIKFKKEDTAILLHASFDPVSDEIEKIINPKHFKIYNIYGNRHEEDKAIEISNKVFPPNPNQEIVDPTKMPDQANSVDYIFAMTSAHEILTQENRIKFFKEAKRILKEGGTLIVCEQLRDWTNFLFFNIGAFHFVSLNNWRKAIASADLSITKMEKIMLWGTIMYVKKM